MTNEEYRACIKGFGLTPMKPSYDGSKIHQGRDGIIYTIPDPETMSEAERDAFVRILKSRMDITDH